MNPELDTSPGLGLPQPSAEIGQAPFGYAPNNIRGPEVSAPRFESIAPSSAIQTQASQSSPLPQLVSVAPPPGAVAADQDSVQDDSADTSAMDAEWVSRAKEIVERTHTDPYLQSKELNKFKAQFIKVKYNKEVNVSEEP